MTMRSESETAALRCFCGFVGDWVAIRTHECPENDPGTHDTSPDPPIPPHGVDPADWPDEGVTY